MVKTITFTIPLQPVTKKNSQRIVMRGGKPLPLPSAAFEQYQKDVGYFIPCKHLGVDYPVNIKVVYYMKTRRRVDLVNLLEATCDVLTHYGVLEDDNSGIVASHDGSRVLYDKDNPRAEIEITEVIEND